MTIQTMPRNSKGQFSGVIQNLVGQRFGRLVVLKFSHLDKWRTSCWTCLCSCGKIVTKSRSRLTSGNTRSCGCYQHEVRIQEAKKRFTKYGKSGTEEYRKEQKKKERATKYGLTVSAIEDMKISQNGRCKICKKQTDNLYIDHDHKTGKVRGLLWQHCNWGLGHFSDNISLLAEAIQYLQIEA